MSVRDAVVSGAAQVISSPKTAAVVSAATTGTGAADWFELIPNDIGKAATLVGILLSVILIRVHLLTVEKIRLEIKVLREKEEVRLASAEERTRAGQPTRRSDDP